MSDFDKQKEVLLKKIEAQIKKFEPTGDRSWVQWGAYAGIVIGAGTIIYFGSALIGLEVAISAAVGGATASTTGAIASLSAKTIVSSGAIIGGLDASWSKFQEWGFADPDNYTNGGKSTYLNFYFHLMLSDYYNTIEKLQQDTGEFFEVENFLIISNSYLNDRAIQGTPVIPTALYEDVYTENNIKEFKFIASQALNSFIFNKNEVNEDISRIIQKSVYDSLSNGDFEEKFGINQIELKTGLRLFSYNDAIKKSSLGVKRFITKPATIEVQINDPKQRVNDKKNFFLRKDVGLGKDWYVYPQNVEDSLSKPTISKELLTEEIVEANSLNKDIITWPTDVIKEESEEMNSLKSFNEINEEKNITTYKFKFYNPTNPSNNFLAGVDNWFSSVDYDSSNFLSFLMVTQYLGFIEQIYKVLDDPESNLNSGGRSKTLGEIATQFFDSETSPKAFNFLKEVYYHIAIDKEIARRIGFINKILEISEDPNRQAGALTNEEIELARKSGLNAFKKTEVENIKIEGLDEEAIKNLQKVFKQCALMININKLADDYNSDLLNDYSEMPYNGRFYVLKSGGANSSQETILSKLVSSEQEQELFELDPWQVSTLTPMFRLFKVMEDANGRTKEVEFIFERTSKIDRGKAVKGPDYTSPQHTFMSSGIDKGSGVGVKQFSIDFQGTNPAEARNDIKANLTLFFQSFTDFIRYRNSTSDPENTYRYVDLVIQPVHSSKVEISNTLQYDPSFYRIRADLGYYVPSFAGKKLKEAIEFSNKSFTLTMVDHDIKFNNDGSVEISIEYRAYLESLLKHPRLDALASPELIEKRIENSKKLADEINKRQCSKEQLRELQLSLQVQEEELIKKSLQSIMTRLIERGKIYNAQIKEEDKQHFINYGFFSECNLEILQENIDDQNVDIGKVMSTNLPEESDEFDFADSSDTLVQYFYFGDLLYTILDCVYDEQDKPREGLENNKIVLGSFEFDSFSSSGNNVSIYGINEMPISVDFFSRWFVDNITSQKNTRTTFPVLNFIRQLSNSLIRQSLIENCVNRKLEKNLRFQTGQITSFSKSGEPMAPISKKFFSNGETIINIDEARVDGLFPFAGGQSEKSDVNNYYNYIVLSAMGSTLTYTGTGKYSEDIKQGRFHVHLGQSSGLVKNISLSKTNQTYLKEARFFQNGIDGLLQLSNVYVATLEMFGNTIFYPGMEFFFNPYGLGGEAEFGRPQDQNSVAWKMGIGGYHTVTSVKTTLTPGKFSTTVTGQQYYSGDGSGNSNLKKEGLTKLKSINEYEPDWGSSGKEAKMEACATVIAQVQWGDKFVDNRTAEEIEEQFYPTSDNTDPAAEPIETESILPPESENNELTNLFELETSQQE